MARQITVLEQIPGHNGVRVINCVFWFPVSVANKKLPIPGFTSKATNVTASEQADLESGTIREKIVTLDFPDSYTTVQMKAIINARYTDMAAAVAAEPALRAFYSVTFDSVSGWSA